ncbi:MAG: GNAT family N-acetyltransferase, partial [Clostridia bacterium]|nr:GNAT family N-acetyltransferase [Clostridia bacterium]
MSRADYDDLAEILKDDDVMYAYEGAFSDEEVERWLQKQLERYERDGFGLNAAVIRQTGEMIGQCGLTLQEVKGRTVIETGYLFKKAYWHMGYATEAATACRDYAFNVLGADEVFAIIRDTNIASQNVATRLGMTQVDAFVKHYRGIDMPHFIFPRLNFQLHPF